MTTQPKQFREMTTKIFNLTSTFHDESTINDWAQLLGAVDLNVLGDVYGKIFESGDKLNAMAVVNAVKDHYKTEGGFYFDRLVKKISDGEVLSERGLEYRNIFVGILEDEQTPENVVKEYKIWRDQGEDRKKFAKKYCEKYCKLNAQNMFKAIADKANQQIGGNNGQKHIK